MDGQNITRGFAAALHQWPADAPAVRDACRLLLIDSLAVAAAGASEAGPTIMAEQTRADGGAPIATVIGHGFATSPGAAARINGMSMHVLDYEPMWDPPNHAMSPLLPALLAKAEQRERAGAPAQGAGLLRAIAKGVEAQGRLRLASREIEPHGARFHPPGVVGPLAAAVGCGELLGLDVEQLAMALAIAGSCGAGIIGNVGSMTKALHCGNAAMRGLECADLASRGFTGDADGLGGPRGYGQAYFGDKFEPAPLVAPVGTPRVLEPGMAWKLFPSQYATHFTISAALDCRKAIRDPAAIETVTVTTPTMAYIDRPKPASGLAGKFSYQYGVAASLLDGRIDLDSFSDQRRFAADMEAMLPRIRLTFDGSISGRLDRMYVDVAVRLRDGTVIERRCTAPDGHWTRPVDRARVLDKARSLLERCLSPTAAKAFWETAEADPSSIRIATLMDAVRDRRDRA